MQVVIFLDKVSRLTCDGTNLNVRYDSRVEEVFDIETNDFMFYFDTRDSAWDNIVKHLGLVKPKRD